MLALAWSKVLPQRIHDMQQLHFDLVAELLELLQDNQSTST